MSLSGVLSSSPLRRLAISIGLDRNQMNRIQHDPVLRGLKRLRRCNLAPGTLRRKAYKNPPCSYESLIRMTDNNTATVRQPQTEWFKRPDLKKSSDLGGLHFRAI